MNFKNWFRGNTPLQLAIERGLKPGANLASELDELDDYTVKSKGDAQAICVALQAVEEGRLKQAKQGESPFHALAGLFQETEGGSAACDYLREHGIPLLIILTRKYFADPGSDRSELLFALKMLAAYGTPEGTDLVIEMAKARFAEDQYLWSVVMSMYSNQEHLEAPRLFAELSDPLPDKFLAISLLDAANQFHLNGGEARHPYDSDAGVEKLEQWLKISEPEYFSYSRSATGALPFISHPERDALFQIAFDHPSPDVTLEAAWAAAKLEQPGGLKKLVALCKSVNHSVRAKAYLKELDRDDAIPAEANLPEFRVKAEFANWLAHPNELGRYPDDLEIVDHRDLRWPGSNKLTHFWLLKYRVKDTTGLEPDNVDIGVVGEGVWCHFTYDFLQRHPEDAYAIHCYWDLAGDKLISDGEADTRKVEYDSLLGNWTGKPLENATVTHVCELSPQLAHARRLVGVAPAVLDANKGWVVLDGPESRWYAEDELPKDESAHAVLKLHIGRRLLGFKDEPDRRSFLRPPVIVAPEQIQRVYEKLLTDIEKGGTAAQRKQLIGNRGLLSGHFEAYVEAKHSLRGGNKNEYIAETYERILNVAKPHPDEADELLDNWSALGKNFEAYVQAVVELKRPQAVVALIELFAPHWQHNLGYGTLGGAAFKAGRDDIAEKFCLQLKSNLEDWQRSEEISHLAEIWHRQGKSSEAQALLLECMRKMLEDGRKAEGSDIKFYEDHFQMHRKTLLRLFPGMQLSDHGIPDSTF